ncbi:hypothetical protein EV700_3249 [Fluviicoccus keumensis]|uniref:Lipid A deacylase LpxR family protein n=1 Tax=Fluviicoccus keumensis TaxID=1435465 RepID=A0A4Q7YJX5_9GAMM|nr:lipid A deacylase LpxR family protein [Fluviicoccus keumensis]RZU36779.1 hypothetical protein EV700_3249 [Fluviicoccus keumensis]
MRHSLLLLSLLCTIAPGYSQADNAPVNFFTFTFENDFFAGKDYGYTSGTQLDWAHGDARTYDEIAPHWITSLARPLWLSQDPNQRRAVSYKIGLATYTPQDISDQNPPKDDLPYSGLLYWKGTLHAYDDHVADRAYLTLGIVGPASGAAAAQKTFHRIIGSQQPEGWSTQLDNEPVFKIGVARKWRTAAIDFDDSPWGMDLITHAEVGAGTFESTADLTFSMRLGKNLMRSFPTAGLLPGRDTNQLAGELGNDIYFFIAVMARYQPNAIYVQGNNFGGKETDLTLRQEQYFLSGGLSWNRGNWGYEYALARSTKIFNNAHADQVFGSLGITYRY